MNTLALGLDLVEVDRIRGLLQRTGDAFKQKIFTAEEVAYCDANADPAIHYAARWAAKEAVAKALGTGFSDGVSWADIAVQRQPNGAPQIHLSGRAAALAAALGIQKWLLALTHTHTTAAASAVGLG